MGAKQSKRSVDITTDKEVVVGEGGEVAMAGGEGKLEKIEDLDTLKPQLNGDTAHQDVEISDKEKKMQQQDEALENEKDTNNEKDIILSPVTNGTHDDAETPKETVDNIESETNKKNKKEKVKKKWSFRSFSFNKKDKQKPSKKEETNGECEKVPEEAVESPVPVSNETESKIETEASEKEISKTDEKTPETPVTEPMTNGSSAPESPKEEEVRQNGDTASIEETAAPAPVVTESIKPAETVEPPSVESLPVNGLKIEDSAEESKVVTDNKLAESSVPEVEAKKEVEAKAEVVESEVCVVKEKVEVTENAETAPPPLPVNPPPSSLTIFAESTMAPHLVDKSVVGDVPVVDVDASVSIPPQPITESAAPTDAVIQQEATNESKTSVCESNPPVDVLSSVSPNKIDSQLSSASNEEGVASSNKDDENPPLTSASTVSEISETIDNSVSSKVVESLAVVSPENTEPPAPEPILTNPPDNTVISADSNVQQELPISNVMEISASVKKEILPVDTEPVVTNVQPQPSDSNEKRDLPQKSLDLSSIENVNETPLAQRTPSDPDISENALPSDSFPPPPPPASCPESITELSVSESLPPPPSEYSQPETVLNSPTSEISDLPTKDMPSSANVEQKECFESEALQNVEPQASATNVTELITSNKVAETPSDQTNTEDSRQLPSAEISSQEKSAINIEIPSVESAPIATETIASETAAVVVASE